MMGSGSEKQRGHTSLPPSPQLLLITRRQRLKVQQYTLITIYSIYYYRSPLVESRYSCPEMPQINLYRCATLMQEKPP